MSRRAELYDTAARDFGPSLDRLAAAYEADRDKRHDLRQEIHLQLWRSLEHYDGRCSLRTWVLRVAHNTAISHVARESRLHSRCRSLDDVDALAASAPDPGRQLALERLYTLIRELKPLDRQIMLCYLEELDAAAISDITGLTAANVAMKIHRIKSILARRFHQEEQHA